MAVDSMLLNHCAQSKMMYKLSAVKMRRQISCCFYMSIKSLKSFESDLIEIWDYVKIVIMLSYKTDLTSPAQEYIWLEILKCHLHTFRIF